jgi:hypothetical protein
VRSDGEEYRSVAGVGSLMNLNVPWRLDPHSRLHLRRFPGRVALLVMCCASVPLIDKNAPVLFLSLPGTVSRLTGSPDLSLAFSIRGESLDQAFAPGITTWDSSCFSSDGPLRLI